MEYQTSTHQKALRVNLDAVKHGTFAEIGAGQEVARWFFHVGGAAGTVAKSISAYDMGVSDSMYGKSDRYVSRERLEAILDQEYTLLISQLADRRPAGTTFFVFADTMATRSFSRHEDGHGWMGIRFQHEVHAEPSEIILHVRMLDHENVREQEAIGVLGVNLVYAAFYHAAEPDALIGSLIDELSPDRIEIDLIRFSGPCFADVDNRLAILQLVVQGFTGAVMFTAGGEVVQPADVMFKRPVLVERGSFRPVTNLTFNMLEGARKYITAQTAGSEQVPVVVFEMTLRNLLRGDKLDHEDFLARVDVLGALGNAVMITSYGPYYQLGQYLRRYTQAPVVLALGIPALKLLFDPKYYLELPGGMLEGFGQLFRGDTTLYVYPSRDSQSDRILTLGDLDLMPAVKPLFDYLVAGRRMVPATDVDESQLHIFPADVLTLIQAGDPRWETMVPKKAGDTIKSRKLFGAGGVTANASGESGKRSVSR